MHMYPTFTQLQINYNYRLKARTTHDFALFASPPLESLPRQGVVNHCIEDLPLHVAVKEELVVAVVEHKPLIVLQVNSLSS